MQFALLIGFVFLTFSTVKSQTKDTPKATFISKTGTINAIDNQSYKNGANNIQTIQLSKGNGIKATKKNSALTSAKLVKRSTDMNDSKWQKGGIYEGFTPDQEIIEKRTRNTKHFLNPDGCRSWRLRQFWIYCLPFTNNSTT